MTDKGPGYSGSGNKNLEEEEYLLLKSLQMVAILPYGRRSSILTFTCEKTDDSILLNLVQTVESPMRLSGKICPREVPRVMRISQGVQP